MEYSLNFNGKRDFELETYHLELQVIDRRKREVANEILKLIHHNKFLEARRQEILSFQSSLAAIISPYHETIIPKSVDRERTCISGCQKDEAHLPRRDGSVGPDRSRDIDLLDAEKAQEIKRRKEILKTQEKIDASDCSKWTSKGIHMDSAILSNSVVYEKKIEEWLASVQRTSTPRLIFRASRDGWQSKYFQRHCAGNGATVVVIKTSKGYIFGGYSDVVWTRSRKGCYKPSNEAFLFVLKCPQDLDACKMDIVEGMESKATYHSINFGPSFGSGSDLHIASNANADDVNHSAIGNTFQFPYGVTDPYFLTGSRLFQIAEYELFHV